MSYTRGYLYVRTHPAYDMHGAVKIGKTGNILDRDAVYATGEITRGIFSLVIEVDYEDMGYLETLLKIEFAKWHVCKDAGTEFFDKQIVDNILPYFEKERIVYRVLTYEEIYSLPRTSNTLQYIEDTTELTVNDILGRLKSRKPMLYVPRVDQEEIITDSLTHFDKNDKGILVLMCGVGKTLISLWICQRLGVNTIIIGVPNMLLLSQWEKMVHLLFMDIPIQLVDGDCSMVELERFVTLHRKRCIIITTYSSSYKVVDVCTMVSFQFDMKILDEVHHITSGHIRIEKNRQYIKVLDIPCIKQMSLTATLKHLVDVPNNTKGMVSNDDVSIFGEIIASRGLSWAISNGILCDYVVQTIIADTTTLENHGAIFTIHDEVDRRLFLSAFASIKSIYIGHSHHLLIYANNTSNTHKIISYIDMLLNAEYFTPTCNVYRSVYNSELSSKDKHNILERFEASTFGILVCVYCLGEGWDLPLLDGVVFAENMTSNIRIVQSALRASRKNIKEPNKQTKIILPIYDPENDLMNPISTNPDLKKVITVIGQLSREDETSIHKIQSYRMNIQPYKKTNIPNELIDENMIGIHDEDLTKFTLRTVHRTEIEDVSIFGEDLKIFKNNFIHSTISECKINNEVINITKYNKLFIHLLHTLDTKTILQKIHVNMVQEEKVDKGFRYYRDIGLSIQGMDATKTLKQIIRIIKIKGYTMDLKIKLKTEEIVSFSIHS